MKKNIQFRIEIGKNKGKYTLKSSYKTVGQALSWYGGYNMGYGHKKRLVLQWEQLEFVNLIVNHIDGKKLFEGKKKWITHRITLAKYDSSIG